MPDVRPSPWTRLTNAIDALLGNAMDSQYDQQDAAAEAIGRIRSYFDELQGSILSLYSACVFTPDKRFDNLDTLDFSTPLWSSEGERVQAIVDEYARALMDSPLPAAILSWADVEEQAARSASADRLRIALEDWFRRFPQTPWWLVEVAFLCLNEWHASMSTRGRIPTIRITVSKPQALQWVPLPTLIDNVAPWFPGQPGEFSDYARDQRRRAASQRMSPENRRLAKTQLDRYLEQQRLISLRYTPARRRTGVKNQVVIAQALVLQRLGGLSLSNVAGAILWDSDLSVLQRSLNAFERLLTPENPGGKWQ